MPDVTLQKQMYYSYHDLHEILKIAITPRYEISIFPHLKHLSYPENPTVVTVTKQKGSGK